MKNSWKKIVFIASLISCQSVLSQTILPYNFPRYSGKVVLEEGGKKKIIEVYTYRTSGGTASSIGIGKYHSIFLRDAENKQFWLLRWSEKNGWEWSKLPARGAIEIQANFRNVSSIRKKKNKLLLILK